MKIYSLNDRIKRTEAVYTALGEAAYEGNLGAIEVAQFYMNADDQEIAQFETELESGNETAAWDIVQHFTGVNLVGIGSDTQDDGEIARQVAESFRRSKKTLTWELLYEMIADAMVHEEDVEEATKKKGAKRKKRGSERRKDAKKKGAKEETVEKTTDLKKIMDYIIAAIKKEKGYEAVLDLKKKDAPTISGLDRNQRIEIAKDDWLLNKAKEITPTYAKASLSFRTKKSEQDIPDKLELQGIGRIFIKQGSSYKPGGVQLEQAVVDAINGAVPKYFGEFANNLKYSKHKFSKAVKLDAGPITKEWKEWGGADTTSKADIT